MFRQALPASGGSLPAKDLPDKDWQAGWQAGAYGGKTTATHLRFQSYFLDFGSTGHYIVSC